jgi:Uma2 family endonuclease
MAQAASTHPTGVTAARFLASPDDFPQHSQLIEGQVVVSEPQLLHARITAFLLQRIGDWCRSQPGRGEVFLPIDVPIDAHNVFAPDVSWYAEPHRPARESVRVDRVPDLAIEVRSPSTWRYDIGVKPARYERAGLAELWLVDTASRTVLVLRRSSAGRAGFDTSLEIAEGETLTSPRLPGLAIDVAELFDR